MVRIDEFITDTCDPQNTICDSDLNCNNFCVNFEWSKIARDSEFEPNAMVINNLFF